MTLLTHPLPDDAPEGVLMGTARRPPMGWGHLLTRVGLTPPGMSLVVPAQVPAPPLLDGLDDEATWLRHLSAAWVGAVASRYPGRRAGLRFPSSYSTGARRTGLVAGAHALHEHGVAPAAWAAFVCDRWRMGYAPRDVDAATTAPAPGNVYRAADVPRHLDWFLESGTCCGTRIVLGPKYRRLHALWADLHDALMRARVRDEAGARAVVARVFGIDMQVWEAAVWDARREARAMQARLNEQVTEGAWLW